jgi:ComF family protein
MDIPRTRFHVWHNNPMEEHLFGHLPLVRAAAYYYYMPDSPYMHLVRRLKYHGEGELGVLCGRLMASEIAAESRFFDGIDVVVPIPLHPKKQRKRGYNQSERIVAGICEATGLTADTTAVARVRNTESQTRKDARARQENMERAFEVVRPEDLRGKHILLVDDVFTTGATILACAEAIACVGDVSISVLTLSCAKRW